MDIILVITCNILDKHSYDNGYTNPAGLAGLAIAPFNQLVFNIRPRIGDGIIMNCRVVLALPSSSYVGSPVFAT